MNRDYSGMNATKEGYCLSDKSIGHFRKRANRSNFFPPANEVALR